MNTVAAPQPLLHHRNLLWWVVASAAAHVLLMHGLPGWRPAEEKTPPPLTVELLKPPAPPPEIIPPQPLPMEPQPQPLRRERVQPQKPEPQKPQPAQVVPREAPPVESPRAPILAAPPEVPVTAATPVVPPQPEQKPAPPQPPPALPRAPPVAAPAPVTAPRYDSASYLHNPKPEYPPLAASRRETGTVYVYVLVDKEGKPAKVSLHKTSGSILLDRAALRAIQGWRFVPARQGSEAVEGDVIVPMPFTLTEER